MWSKTKKGLNDRLAYSLRNRVSYQFEVFRTNAGNKTKMRVFSIVADGKIIFVSNPKARAVECDFVNEQTEKLQKQYPKHDIFKLREQYHVYTEAENIKGIRKISDLKNRCKIGAEYSESIFVSIHMNSFGNEKYSGLHVYYAPESRESEMLAQAIQNRVRNDVQPNNNRVPKPGKNIYLLENLENTAVLVECGFLTNKAECEKLSEKEYQKELSFAIVCGIIEYINTARP